MIIILRLALMKELQMSLNEERNDKTNDETSSQMRSSQEGSLGAKRSSRSQSRLRSRSGSQRCNNDEPVEYEEDGQLMSMHIQPGEGFSSKGEPQTEEEAEESGSDSDLSQCSDSEDEDESEAEKSDAGETLREVTPRPTTSKDDRRKIKKAKQSSLKSQVEQLSNTLMGLTDIMQQHGFLNEPAKRTKQAEVPGETVQIERSVDASNSELTIYKDVLNKETLEVVDSEITFNMGKSQGKNDRNRDSSSSDDQIDTSDKLIEVDLSSKFIADCKNNAQCCATLKRPFLEDRDEPAPPVCGENSRQAESERARIFTTPGKNLPFWSTGKEDHSPMLVDENYSIVGSHVDTLTKEKIINGAYADFAKLIPKERIT